MTLTPVPFDRAVALINEVISDLPQQEHTVIPKPDAMFNRDTLEPQDIIGRFLIKAGFNPETLRHDPAVAQANTKHFWLTGYRAFFDTDLLGGPHFKTQVYLSDLIRKMDRGIAAGKASAAAIRYTESMQAREAQGFPHMAHRWEGS